MLGLVIPVADLPGRKELKIIFKLHVGKLWWAEEIIDLILWLADSVW